MCFYPGTVYNVFEAVDVITLIRGGVYDDLSLPVGEALKKRSPVSPLSCLPMFLLLLKLNSPVLGLSRYILLLGR